MFELIRVAIALVGSIACGIWDLKTTNVPDSVCAVMIAAGLLFFGVEGWMTGDWTGLMMSLIAGGLFAAFGLGMYLTGQWGGGDGELLAAIGILLPMWPFAAKSIFSLPIAFFVNVFFVAAIYTIAYAALYARKKPKLLSAIRRDVKADGRVFAPLAVGAVVAVAVLWTMSGAAWLFLLPIAIVGLPILYRLLKNVEDGFYERIPTSKLKPDDMLGEDIPRLGLSKRHIRGLTVAEVKKIKKLKSFVVIRDGVRFTPSLAIALVITLLIGDLATFIISYI